jgi:hypothetical protein
MKRRILTGPMALALASALFSAPLPSRADETRVPAKLAVLVMLKVLTYDKNLAARGDGDFVILVAYEPGQAGARSEVEAMAVELKGALLQSRAVRFEYAEFQNEAALKKAVADRGAKALLLLPGLSANGLTAASSVSIQSQIYSLSLDPALVEKTVAVGVANKDGRPQIVLNLAAARRVNAAFEPSVLKLAKLIQ